MMANFFSDIRRVPVNRTTVPAPVIPRSNDVGYLCVGSPPGVDWVFRGSVVPSSGKRVWSHVWCRRGKQAFEEKEKIYFEVGRMTTSLLIAAGGSADDGEPYRAL